MSTTTTAIIINDYPTDRRTQLVFTPDDFEIVENNWEETDRLLMGLREVDQFKGRERWCDLDPTHWRILILSNLVKAAALDEETSRDAGHPVIKSLHFLIAGLIVCLELRSESKIELMHINRVGNDEVAYDYAACLNMAVDRLRPTSFRVVVDNT